jgi:uncharacterized protein (UPF0332 family)
MFAKLISSSYFRLRGGSMKEEMKALIVYRLEQAEESLDSAQLLLDHGKYRPSVNRSYYAMFYAILALLVPTKQQTSKHSWVITLFDRDFVRKGVFNKDFSHWLHEAFDLRQNADYRELVTVSAEQAQEILSHAWTFVVGVKNQITNMMSEAEVTATLGTDQSHME